MSGAECTVLNDVTDAIIDSDNPFSSAMEVIIAMVALAGVIAKDEEKVFGPLEHLIKEARQHRHERHR